jgi:O-antigen ligase
MNHTAGRWGGAAAVLGAALALGRVGATRPLLFALVLAGLAGVAAVAVARRTPRAALTMGVFAVLVAGTKFRMRDPTASLGGDLDSQVMFELALFAAAGCAVLGAMRSLGRGGRLEWRVVKPAGVEWPLVAYTLFAGTSAFWSPTPMLTLVRTAQLFVVLLLGMALRRVRGPSAVLEAVGMPLLVYVGACAVTAKLFTWAKGTQVDYLGFHRFSWFSVHPITAATAAAAAALFVVVDLSFAEDRWRARRFGVPTWSLLPPLLAVLAATNSRGPLFAFVAAVGALLLLRHMGRLGGGLLVTAAAGLMLLILVTGVTPDDLMTRLGAGGGPIAKLLLRGQTADEVSGLTGRTELWEGAERIIAANWVVGVGYQGSRALLLAVEAWAAYAHNALLQTLLDLGVTGASLLFIPLLRPLFSGSLRAGAARAVLRGRGAALTMTVFLLVNSVSSESFAAAPSFETLLAFSCILSLERRAARKAPAQSRALAQAVRRPTRGLAASAV